MRILLAVQPADFRKASTAWLKYADRFLKKIHLRDMFSFSVTKKATAIKVLINDGQGFWQCQKKLSKGRFNWWPVDNNSCLRQLAVYELHLLIWKGQLEKSHVAPLWKPFDHPGEKFEKKLPGRLTFRLVMCCFDSMSLQFKYRGKVVSGDDVTFINQLICNNPNDSRRAL